MSKGTEFMDKLASLMEEYDASLSYTTDDDGIHVYVGGELFYKSFDLTDWNVGKHDWQQYGKPGMYDTIYRCSRCRTLHSVSIDIPGTALPEKGCQS